MNKIIRLVTAMSLLLLGGSSIAAQSEFNPENPPEPLPTYKVTVKATPSEYAYASGSGHYSKGKEVYISASSKDSDYEFQYWEKDGVRIDEPNGFYYIVEEKNTPTIFTAVYDLIKFDPSSPEEPSYTIMNPLYLTCTPEEACSFNINNGTQYEPEQWIEVSAYPSQGFVLQGWYENGQLISEAQSFNYQMPNAKTTLTVSFKYDPVSPQEPSSSANQQEISNPRGDVNGDGDIDVSDATVIVNWFLENTQGEYELKYDMNLDNVIDIKDSTTVINEYLDK